MALVKQSGRDPAAGMRRTSMGLREGGAPVCNSCRERKEGQIYSRTPNGQFVCEDCASPRQQEVLRGTCDPQKCSCGRADADPTEEPGVDA